MLWEVARLSLPTVNGVVHDMTLAFADKRASAIAAWALAMTASLLLLILLVGFIVWTWRRRARRRANLPPRKETTSTPDPWAEAGRRMQVPTDDDTPREGPRRDVPGDE
jgi:hypothetical protein